MSIYFLLFTLIVTYFLFSRREPVDHVVQTWMTEIKHHYEQECMTTLQAKSIAGELHQKVANIATDTTASIKDILTHSECIKLEYKNLNRCVFTKFIYEIVQENKTFKMKKLYTD